MNIMAIETSCDETSVAIVRDGYEVLSNVVLSQIDIHKKYGGVVPEIASRHHVNNITIVIDEALKKANLKKDDIDAVAVTYGPGLKSALLVGVEAAKAISYVLEIPLIPVHHLAGHIYANRLVETLKFPLIALVVSGGHTELVLMKEDYSFKIVGETFDDAVGECYDKVARVLNVGYPGGPVIDKLAQSGVPTYELPLPLNDDSLNYSFSGLKSAVINLAHNLEQRKEAIISENLAASFQKVVVEVLVDKTIRAAKKYNAKQILLAGGVAANKSLRETLILEAEKLDQVEVLIPPISYCTDNAAMIGAAAYFAYQKGITADFYLDAKPNIPLK
ncbi:MAG TPA: tRNA (adenosine(37)-N6)-threonylcarbamoyltransferase complex transferase subunit TsaD [Tenericutes bacterium]|jgi:N6-L-threonylcarbamoyladenine synthase|nr:tRNA (adenosine(37)-N6)-threonylcarbamoyltransferase complex transferase subunit TsaD [Mycoplasmatota bacterium]